jgi:hypothetical protein
MHDTAKADGAALLVADIAIKDLERVYSGTGRDEDASLIWEGETTDGHPVRVSVRLGNLAIFLEKGMNGNRCEQEVLQVNLGRLAEIARRAEHNLGMAKRRLLAIREVTREEEDCCWNAAASDPEVRLFESLRVTPMADAESIGTPPRGNG